MFCSGLRSKDRRDAFKPPSGHGYVHQDNIRALLLGDFQGIVLAAPLGNDLRSSISLETGARRPREIADGRRRPRAGLV